MPQNISIIIVEKSGSLKSLTVKDYKEEELYKKCGFKQPDGFTKQTEWGIKLEGKKYIVSVYAKTEGRANTENKYDFPPPVDTLLFFGNCSLVCSLKQADDSWEVVSLTIEKWEKIYEKLFGGFEDLAVTCVEDEEEEDELDNISASKKTKHGYLKDGFVVDSDSDEKEEYDSDESEFESSENELNCEDVDEQIDFVLDIGSELSEDEYESEDEEHNNSDSDDAKNTN